MYLAGIYHDETYLSKKQSFLDLCNYSFDLCLSESQSCGYIINLWDISVGVYVPEVHWKWKPWYYYNNWYLFMIAAYTVCIIQLYCACQFHSKSPQSEPGVRNCRQIVVFDFDPLGSNRKCNANKLKCIFKTNTLLISSCTINAAICISNVGSSHGRDHYPEPAALV